MNLATKTFPATFGEIGKSIARSVAPKVTQNSESYGGTSVRRCNGVIKNCKSLDEENHPLKSNGAKAPSTQQLRIEKW